MHIIYQQVEINCEIKMNVNDNDDMSSMCSSFSQVSFNGESVPADQAIDESMKSIQTGLNNTHVLVRNMLTSDERDEGYEVIKPMYDELASFIDEGVSLLRELKKIGKQMVPKPPKGASTSTSTSTSSTAK